jgi:hypothetical protein
MRREATLQYFLSRFDDLSARIAAVDTASAQGRREMLDLFQEHSALAEDQGSRVLRSIVAV